jgi:glutamate synthase domain-containing protein 3
VSRKILLSGGIIFGDEATRNEMPKQHFIGTGMHGSVIYIRGEVEKHQLGKEVGVVKLEAGDREVLNRYISEFFHYFPFSFDAKEVLKEEFIKLFAY